jgi:hypothetical protein
MRIASSSVDFSSTHVAAERTTHRESLRAWVGSQRPNFEALEGGRDEDDTRPAGERPEDRAERRATDARRVAGLARRLEMQAASALKHSHKDADHAPRAMNSTKDGAEEDQNLEPRTRVIKLLVEAMTGRKIKIVSLDEPHEAQANGEAGAQQVAQQQQRVGWGVEYERHETHDEFEQTSFSAQGVVKTADGKEITFSYDLDMERQFHSEEHESVRAGDALLKDPLVINFGGTAAQLTDKKFAFDLDADGKKDQMSWVQPGSGFLALDKNGNGAIDDGSELFGAKTGNGFAELSAYDDDRNGWIDEADTVYGKLQVWSKSGSTDQHASLKDRNVGAIYLGQTATPFAMKDDANQLQGAVRATGVYVKEDGSGAGSVQQIDLVI